MADDNPIQGIDKARTGIAGLDDILAGGIPRGRPTLVCGGAGCGKTLLALESLCRGITDSGEPGVFVSFEESPDDLRANALSLGLDLAELEASGQLILDHVPLSADDYVEAGGYDLEGLILRIGASVDEIGAQRVALDTIEVLFGSLHDTASVRAALKELFHRLKARGLTTVVTSERGDGSRLTRNGVEEYVSDCVIVLDHRIMDQRSTRRLRVAKYRGSRHAADEYPFLISDHGITVLPISSLRLDQAASFERISTGISALDGMLSGGIFRGTTVLVSGPAGTGKSTFATHFAVGSCRRGERVLHVSFEESASQIKRNMRSVGFDLDAFADEGLLRFETLRPTMLGLEAHLESLRSAIEELEPALVVIDPITSLQRVGAGAQAAEMLMRVVDLLKSHGITAVFTALTDVGGRAGGGTGETHMAVSSLVDTWLLTDVIEVDGERNRIVTIVKSRGTAHSNQVTEFVIGETGVEILEPYVGPGGVLTGSARVAQEAAERSGKARAAEELELQQAVLDQRRAAVEAEVAALWANLEADTARLVHRRSLHDQEQADELEQRDLMSRRRWARHPHGGGA